MNGQSGVGGAQPTKFTTVPAPAADKRPKERRSRRLAVEAFQIDREAVRAVISHDAFLHLEGLRAEYLPGEAGERIFWSIARERIVRMAQERPDAALRIMKAKVGAVGAMLRLPPAQIARLAYQVDIPRFVGAACENLCIHPEPGSEQCSIV